MGALRTALAAALLLALWLLFLLALLHGVRAVLFAADWLLR
jgi:hypothetical protein